MLQRIVVVVLSLPFIIIISAYLLPKSTEVSRSIVIERSATDIFPYLNSLERMQLWSPWAKKDPAMQINYSGASEGVGAVMEWKSNKPDVGTGRQEIIESDPNLHLVSKLAFGKQPAAEVHFYLTQQTEKSTEVSWHFISSHGSNPINRYMGLLFDGMLGPDFENGLKGLKTLMENLPEQKESIEEQSIVEGKNDTRETHDE